jgi:hypothetical protein
MKKDDYLASIMQVPPKQPIQILPFDLKTQREAFSISLDGLKGVRRVATVRYSSYLSSAVEYRHTGARVCPGPRGSQETSA